MAMNHREGETIVSFHVVGGPEEAAQWKEHVLGVVHPNNPFEFCSGHLEESPKQLASAGFQKRHFEAIAEVIREVKQMAELRSMGDSKKLAGFLLGVGSVQGELVRIFRAGNAKFDFEKFHRACEPTKENWRS